MVLFRLRMVVSVCLMPNLGIWAGLVIGLALIRNSYQMPLNNIKHIMSVSFYPDVNQSFADNIYHQRGNSHHTHGQIIYGKHWLHAFLGGCKPGFWGPALLQLLTTLFQYFCTLLLCHPIFRHPGKLPQLVFELDGHLFGIEKSVSR